MSEIDKRQKQIAEDFSVFDDWMDKYDYLIDLGKDLQKMDENLKSDQTLIKDCQSKVWLNADLVDGKINFQADSDAIITKGIIALLIKVVSGLEPKEIMNANFYFINKIGLQENLSPTRSNGLVSMIKQIKMYALAYHTKLNS